MVIEINIANTQNTAKDRFKRETETRDYTDTMKIDVLVA